MVPSVADVGDTAAAVPAMPLQPLVDVQKRGEGRVTVTSREPLRHCRWPAPTDVADASVHLKRTSK